MFHIRDDTESNQILHGAETLMGLLAWLKTTSLDSLIAELYVDYVMVLHIILTPLWSCYNWQVYFTHVFVCPLRNISWSLASGATFIGAGSIRDQKKKSSKVGEGRGG